MPTLRDRYEKAKVIARLTGMRARGKPHDSREGKAYKKARAEYHRLGEALMRQSRARQKQTP